MTSDELNIHEEIAFWTRMIADASETADQVSVHRMREALNAAKERLVSYRLSVGVKLDDPVYRNLH